jgi:hypothetical protein
LRLYRSVARLHITAGNFDCGTSRLDGGRFNMVGEVRY